MFAALAEPNRLRIVELLHEAPRAVGEIATLLELRQPQATKHLQTLERAGLVTMHPLGRRRIYAVRRESVRALRRWLEPFEADCAVDDALVQYRQAIEAEERRPDRGAARSLVLRRELPARPEDVWRGWTSAAAVRRWWAPDHFVVADCEVDAVPGGTLRIVLEEGDGSRHVAVGRFLEVRPAETLTFELAPLDAEGQELFSAVYEVQLTRYGERTTLSLTIRTSDARPQAVPALAGLEPGWNQLLDNLVDDLAWHSARHADRRGSR